MSYTITFTEEVVRNPIYGGYIAGRIEVYDDESEYNIGEIRVLTDKVKEFEDWIKKYEERKISDNELDKVYSIIKKRYCKLLY